jgi:peptidoglycan-associated lipoprotein
MSVFQAAIKKEEKMRMKVRLFFLLVLILPFMFAVSCAKQVVGTETAPEPTPTAQAPTQTDAEKRAAEEAAREAQLREERLRAEAAAKGARDRFVNENVQFEFDSAALTADAQRILNEKAAYLRANPNLKATIEGHCDERGTAAYNLALGERRADSARTFLVNLGIEAGRLQIISYGEERPLDTGRNEEAWAKNRRAQFVVN